MALNIVFSIRPQRDDLEVWVMNSGRAAINGQTVADWGYGTLLALVA